MTARGVLEATTLATQWLQQHISISEQTLLTQQGFVSSERLPSGNLCFKLRYRSEDRRQRVVYIGTCRVLAEAIRDRLH